jgi:membrane associated rhomboid family serine protease
MIPLRDSTPSGTIPAVTIAIIAVNCLVWFYEVSLGQRAQGFIVEYGLIPLRFVKFDQYQGGFMDNAAVPLFASIFMHGGWLHIIGNMWFLWIFGDNVEDRLGHFKFLLFYLLCGMGASLFHVMFNAGSRVPTVGASGAISGILGAYLISYPHARVTTLLIIIFFIRIVELPAFLFLIFWFVFQFVSGTSELAAHHDTGGVAYWAHMGGFVVGIVLLWLFPKKPVYRTPNW